MCTSLTLETKDGCHFLGRTMDFAMEFGQCVHFIPRKYELTNELNNQKYLTKYALTGMATTSNNHIIFADGINEEGLACATLYFPGFAEYEDSLSSTLENLAPYDLVLWILCNFKNLNEVKKGLKHINIFNKELSLLGITPPLHWIVTDKSGESIVIEKTSEGLNVFDNKIGVMTNSPDFKWHLSNLRQYIGINPKSLNKTKILDVDLCPFGQGSGTFGLPGDFTPPSRFIRTTFFKNNITHLDNEIHGVTGIFNILMNCSIPKGIVLKADSSEDVTLYTSAMCCESGIYYYKTYDNSQITAINLFKEDFNSKEMKKFAYRNKQALFIQN